ncbi:MAG: DUF4148 domain-containing protein [Burkholderiales bacterium]
MKTSSFLSTSLLTLIASLANPVHAQTTPLSRAEVKAEFLRARAAGELPCSADLFGPALAKAMQSVNPNTKPVSHPDPKRAGTEPSSLATAAQQPTASAVPR